VVVSRLIYVLGVGLPSRHSADTKLARIDIDQREICRGSRGEPGIVGDARTVPRKCCERHPRDALKTAHGDWHRQLSALDTAHPRAQEVEQVPIHPPRLCQEVRGIMDRDAIMAADGPETMDYAWRIITSVVPGHRPDPGSFGTKGVRLFFAPGVAAARPDEHAIVLSGDGSFSLNAPELDSATHRRMLVLVFINLNDQRPGRNLAIRTMTSLPGQSAVTVNS
jgi:acetolactate synthase I/II/III large subunit